MVFLEILLENAQMFHILSLGVSKYLYLTLIRVSKFSEKSPSGFEDINKMQTKLLQSGTLTRRRMYTGS